VTRVALAIVCAMGALAGCGDDGAGPGVVDVLVARPGGVPEHATGFVAGDGRVVTVAHVLDDGGAVSVGDGGTARVLRVDRAADLALLATDAAGAAQAGRGVRVVTAGGAEPVEVRRRIVARVRDSAGSQVYSRRALELAGDIAAGDSGAPVVDEDGELLGVVFARSRRHDGTAYAVDASAVDRLLAPANGGH
jgi:S1-C subfamily serine protease